MRTKELCPLVLLLSGAPALPWQEHRPVVTTERGHWFDPKGDAAPDLEACLATTPFQASRIGGGCQNH